MIEIVETMREAREHFAEVIDRAEREDSPTFITRRGRRVAAVVPLEYIDDHNAMVTERLRHYAADNPDNDPNSLAAVIAETLAREQ
jgi:prevent-host-death family protein